MEDSVRIEPLPQGISPGGSVAGRSLTCCELSFGQTKRHFFFRSDSVGDLGVVRQIFQNNDYDFSHFAVAEKLGGFYKAQAGSRQGLILDLGANIGASAVHFALNFPACKIIALEPEVHNFQLLQGNGRDLDIVFREAAIGSLPGRASLVDPDCGDWGFRVAPGGDNNPIAVLSVGQLLDDFPRERYFPFIAKIDIEGGEAELFSRHSDWLALFPLIIIELHDWLLPGEGNSRNFIGAISRFNFDLVFKGENLFCFNNELLAAR